MQDTKKKKSLILTAHYEVEALSAKPLAIKHQAN